MPQDLFILRKEHEDAFGQAGLRRFQRRAVLLLLKRHPEANTRLMSTTLRAKVDSWLLVARKHGLLSEIALFGFYEAGLFLLLRDVAIEEDKTTLELLARRDLDAEARADRAKEHAKAVFDRWALSCIGGSSM